MAVCVIARLLGGLGACSPRKLSFIPSEIASGVFSRGHELYITDFERTYIYINNVIITVKPETSAFEHRPIRSHAFYGLYYLTQEGGHSDQVVSIYTM